MALSYPYALDFLAKCLVGPVVPLTLRRFDEMSGSGDGRHWAAQMAPPLWTASYDLYAKDAAAARAANAKIYGLDGSRQAFLWPAPFYKGPASGVAGDLSGATVLNIRGTDRGAIGISGLPAGQKLSTGDYLSISYGSGRVYFGQLAEDGTANSGGDLSMREIRPYVPLGVPIGASVELVRPYFKAIIPPGGFTSFAETRFGWGAGASITILQRP